MNKKFWYSLISIIVGVSIICLAIVLLNTFFPIKISKNSMEKQFSRNKDILINVAKYLERQEYSKIYITSADHEGVMFASTSSIERGINIKISDESISKNIHNLFEKYHFSVIVKKQNGIYFQRWSNMDIGRGIVYSINGERPLNEMITILEPLKEANWYFYEEK